MAEGKEGGRSGARPPRQLARRYHLESGPFSTRPVTIECASVYGTADEPSEVVLRAVIEVEWRDDQLYVVVRRHEDDPTIHLEVV